MKLRKRMLIFAIGMTLIIGLIVIGYFIKSKSQPRYITLTKMQRLRHPILSALNEIDTASADWPAFQRKSEAEIIAGGSRGEDFWGHRIQVYILSVGDVPVGIELRSAGEDGIMLSDDDLVLVTNNNFDVDQFANPIPKRS
jgi:hypothetical protein